MTKQSKKSVHVLLVCVYIRQFTVTTMEGSNTISELDGHLSHSQKGPILHEVFLAHSTSTQGD
jgi:hypothetical protein